MADAEINASENFIDGTYTLAFSITISNGDIMKLDTDLLKQLSDSLSTNQSLSFKFYTLEKLFRALGK